MSTFIYLCADTYTCLRGKDILSINTATDFKPRVNIVSKLGVHGLAIATTGNLIRIYIISQADPGGGAESKEAMALAL